VPRTRWEIIKKRQLSSPLRRVCVWLACVFPAPVCPWHPAVTKLCCCWKGTASELVCCEDCSAVDEKQRPAFQDLKPVFFSIFFFFLLALHYISTFSAAVSKACLVSYYSSFQKCQRIGYADWFSKCRFSLSVKTKTILLINLAEIEYSRCRFCWVFF